MSKEEPYLKISRSSSISNRNNNKSEYGNGSICKFCVSFKIKSNQIIRLGLKSNHKVPVQVQVEPKIFFGFWSCLVLVLVW